MHVFYGIRLLEPSECEVFLDGVPLAMPTFTSGIDLSTGFEWGYGGQGPRALATAIMIETFGKQYGPPLVYHFKEFVANLPRLGWILSEADIYGWYSSLTDTQMADCTFWDGFSYVSLTACSALSPFDYPRLRSVSPQQCKEVVTLLATC